MKVGLLEENFSQKLKGSLQENFDVVSYHDEGNNFWENIEIIFIRLKYYIGKDILDKAPNLKYICTPTTGWNHIDVEDAARRDIKIISLKGETDFLNTIRATPEHTFGLCLSLLRNYREIFLSEYSDWRIRNNIQGHELYGNQAGIIGYGRVGKILAHYLNSFGCECYYYDVENVFNPCPNIQKLDSLENLIQKCKIVFLCASYTTSYDKFFDQKYIDLLENKFFIHTARGELLDEEYLIQKIENNFFAGIAIDVVNNETKDINNIEKLISLTKYSNFIFTPHIAGATKESMEKTDLFILKKLIEEIS